ncbi:FIG074102: hypothetical protein [Olavius algarvensis Delta 1 endosymbiont]|nr:FIG074102: hypothetical protein [Olavius algarvensis Delta 1 endosymbiont]
MIIKDLNAPAATAFYKDLLSDIKKRIRQAQNRAAMSLNAEMIRLYWDIGQMVAKRQQLEGWGKGLLRRLAADIKDEIPEIKGFSERNLQLMTQFQKEYPYLFTIPQRPVAELSETSLLKETRTQSVAEIDPTDSIQSPQAPGETQFMQRIVAQLPWAHNVILIQKLKDLPTRLWYARQAIAEGWSRDTLALMIKSDTYKRQGEAVTNFDTQLPAPHAQLAQNTLKDPYIFDFLTLEPAHKLKIDQNKLQNCRSNILNLVNVL